MKMNPILDTSGKSADHMETENAQQRTILTVPTQNRFSILANLVEKPKYEQSSTSNANLNKPKSTQTTRKIKPPPVIIKSNIIKPQEFHQEIKRLLTNQDFKIHYMRDETRIFTSTMEARQCIIDQLINNGINFFTYTPKSEKYYKTVLKAAHFTTEEEIKDVLNETLNNPYNCLKLKSRNSKSHSFLISTQSLEDFQQLNKIKTLDHINIKWENYNKKNLASQCHRCQAFGHGSGHCYMPPGVLNAQSPISLKIIMNRKPPPNVQTAWEATRPTTRSAPSISTTLKKSIM